MLDRLSKLGARARWLWGHLGHRRLRWPRRLAYAIAAVVAAWWIAVWAGEFPMELLERESAASLEVIDGNGIVLRQEATAAGFRESWVSLDEISPHLVHATLASEDNDFFDHNGVDWTALMRATWLNLRGGRYGGSTITMQLVKLTADTERSFTGKLRQMVLAARLERQLDKKSILEHYLNRVYYGNGAWGAEQAARVYFDKSAHELSAGEAAMLAVFPRGPSYYDPFKHWGRAVQRRDHILDLMAKRGYLTAEQERLAIRAPLNVRYNASDFRAPHFVELVKERLPPGFERGAVVETTLDWDLQRRVEVAVESHLHKLEARNVTQSAVVVIRNSDGAILAMVGSRDYSDHTHNGAFNGVTARLRPGSTLKPFVYASAFERGDTPATMAFDVVLPEDAHEFYTKDVRSHGFARYRESLAGSYNLSAVHTLQRAGLRTVLGKLRAAGLETLDRPDNEYDWGLAIGHAEVRLIDLTAAFSTFGRGGVPIVPRAIAGARAIDGTTWSEPIVERPRVFSEEVSYLIYDILSDPDARKPMFGDRVPMNLPFDVALKTGTTKAYTDLWAIGATHEYTVGVWAGNFDGAPTHQVMSVQGATPLMRAVYTAIASRFGDPTSPRRPNAIVSASICPLSGKLAGPHCDRHKHELFITGTVPTETCDWHQEICGQRTIVYPKQVRGWAEFYGKVTKPACEIADTSGPVSIVTPVPGSTFLLEPHRPARFQRPPLAALPAGADVQWTIDGQPASEWIPSPGEHTIVATRGDDTDEISIVYE